MEDFINLSTEEEIHPTLRQETFDVVPGVVGFGPACTNYFTMTGVAFLFQAYCEKLVKKLTNEQLNNFKNVGDDMDRIRHMYSHAAKLPIVEHPDGKSQKDAFDFKSYGNSLYQAKKSREAVKEYNQGIVACPIDTDESRKLLAILIANRSAVLFELGLFKECVQDVDWVLASGWYPENLQYKILVRKGKSCAELKRHKDAIDCVNEAIRIGTALKLPEYKLHDVRHALKSSEEQFLKFGEEKRQECSVVFSHFDRNPLYPSASAAVAFKSDPTIGRHAVATKDIPAGTIVLEEEAFCAAISKDNVMYNCAHCILSTISPFPCDNCASAVFCSPKCKKEAKYHLIECRILPTVYNSGASVNCLMSLRIVTQQGFDFFWTHRNTFDEKIESEVYDAKDYRRIYDLCTHSDLRPKGEFLHYTFMAIFLLRLLKRTAYFPFETVDGVLKEEESYIGSLLLRHLQLLQFNAHELSEMRNCEFGDVPYRNAHVGGAVYATLSLFNHSCEPSIIRYNKGNKMIARTIKYVKAGDGIFENYGPIYCSHEIALRQKKMKERYYFHCRCTPCLEKWPLYQSMDSDTLRLKCQSCDCALIVGKNQDDPFVVCKDCKTKNNIMLTSMQLMKVDGFTTRAEEKFREGDYQGAIKFYQAAMEFYHNYMVPPFQDMVKVQQRLRTCMLHDGNIEVLYKMPTEFLPVTCNSYPVV